MLVHILVVNKQQIRHEHGGARVSYHAKRWHVHVASAFPLARHYRAVFGYS